MDNYNYHIKIGEVIKDLRIKQGMTKVELSMGICSKSYITRIEKGERCPTSLILRQLAHRLKVTPDYLFSIIESPNSLLLRAIINKLVLLVERHDYSGILTYLRKYNDLSIPTVADIQIVDGIKILAETMTNNDYKYGFEQYNKLLDLTYNNKSEPTAIEFTIINTIAYFKFLDGKVDEAYNMIIDLYQYIPNLKLIPTYVIIPRYFVRLIIICISQKKYDEALNYVEEGIHYSKEYNTHNVLGELYILKGELYFYLDNKIESKKYISNAYKLNELICRTNDTQFIKFADERLKDIEL